MLANVDARYARARSRSFALLWPRQFEFHCRTLTYYAANVNGRLVRFHNVLADGQAQARAARLPRAAFLDAVKALKYARLVLGGNATAVVAHGYAHAMAIRSKFYFYVTILTTTVFDSIIYQINKYLPNSISVGINICFLAGWLR